MQLHRHVALTRADFLATPWAGRQRRHPDIDFVDVTGDVYEIEDELVAVLDEIEAVYPGVEDRFLAREVMVKVDGNVVNCRFYPVSPNAVKGLPEIRSGDWVEHRSTR